VAELWAQCSRLLPARSEFYLLLMALTQITLATMQTFQLLEIVNLLDFKAYILFIYAALQHKQFFCPFDENA
jgi:hypothetical protein